MHGLIVGSPEQKKADPAVLRSLCSSVLPNGRMETLISSFEGWASVKERSEMQFDWDDAIGNARRRAAGLRAEALRKGESMRRRKESKGTGAKPPPKGGRKKETSGERKAIKV